MCNVTLNILYKPRSHTSAVLQCRAGERNINECVFVLVPLQARANKYLNYTGSLIRRRVPPRPARASSGGGEAGDGFDQIVRICMKIKTGRGGSRADWDQGTQRCTFSHLLEKRGLQYIIPLHTAHQHNPTMLGIVFHCSIHNFSPSFDKMRSRN